MQQGTSNCVFSLSLHMYTSVSYYWISEVLLTDCLLCKYLCTHYTVVSNWLVCCKLYVFFNEFFKTYLFICKVLLAVLDCIFGLLALCEMCIKCGTLAFQSPLWHHLSFAACICGR